MGFVGARSRGRVVASCLALSGVLLLGSGCGPVMGYFELRSRERMRQQQIAAHQAALEADARARKNVTAEEKLENGDSSLRAGRIDRAAWSYLEAHRRDPDNPVAQERIGFLQVTRDPTRAEVIFNRLLEEDPTRAEAHAGLGLARFAQGNLEGAEAALKRAVDLDPEDPVAINTLAVVYDLQGRHDEAGEQFARLESLRPEDPNVANNVGVSLLLLGNFVDAETALRRALVLSPDDKATWNNLGLALGHQRRYDEALEAFRQAGNEQAAQNNLGYVLYLNGEYQEALAHYESALLEDGDAKPKVLRNLEAARQAIAQR